MRITHVLNPFLAKPGTEHDRAQRVTLASIARSAELAKAAGIAVDVVLVAEPGDLQELQGIDGFPFVQAPPLARNVQDIKKLQPQRSFPLIVDLLQAGVDHGQGDYLVYTNLDIGVQPHFYATLPELIATRPDPAKAAFAINRRTIAEHYTGPQDLDAMYADDGIDHPGWDCFVFPRSFVPQMQLGHSCIGAVAFDSLMMVNLDVLSGYQMCTFARTRMTFHIGDDQSWGGRPSYTAYNGWEGLRMVDQIQQRQGQPLKHGSIAHEHHSRIAGWLWNGSTQFSRLQNKLKRKMLLKFPVPEARAYTGQPRTGSPEKLLSPELFEKLWVPGSTPCQYCPDQPPTPVGAPLDYKPQQAG